MRMLCELAILGVCAGRYALQAGRSRNFGPMYVCDLQLLMSVGWAELVGRSQIQGSGGIRLREVFKLGNRERRGQNL